MRGKNLESSINQNQKLISMTTETINITPNQCTLIYVLQNEFGDFAKGKSLEDAQKRFKRAIKGKGAKYKPKHLAIYIQRDNSEYLAENKAFSEILISWLGISYTTENLILLSQTTLV